MSSGPSESPKYAIRGRGLENRYNGSPSRRPDRSNPPGVDNEDIDSDWIRSRSTSRRSSIAWHRASFDDSASMASTTATDAVPPLIRAQSTGSSTASSADTDRASSILGDGYLLQSHDGVLTVQNRYLNDADLLCPFQILDCDCVFEDVVSFKMHVFSHFRGHELPATASCFLCDDKFYQLSGDDPALAWNNMLSHMVHEHFRRGQQLATVRTDFALMRWMYVRRLISTQQFKRTQMVPIPFLLPRAFSGRHNSFDLDPVPHAPSASPPAAILAYLAQSVGHQNEAFLVNAGRRAERRRLEATRTMVGTQSYL